MLAESTVELTDIRPRAVIDPNTADPTNVKALTEWWPVTATATFRTTAEGVDLSIWLKNCRVAYSYPVRIYDTAECSTIGDKSSAWDGDRGNLSSNIGCLGTAGGHFYYTRLREDPKPWTLGGPASSDLVGRSIAVLDPDTLDPLICGTIEAGDGGAPASDAGSRPAPAVVEQLAGLCPLITTMAGVAPPGSGQTCPDVQKLTDCAWTHCAASCVSMCSEYLACLNSTSSICSSECQASQTCAECVALATQCTLGFCADELACAPPPTPGGPCTALRECCMRQGPVADTCLAYTNMIEGLSGDPTCLGTLNDWDFNAHLAYRSPCYTDGGAPPQ
jgi:hypothetical protein